jgi:hypothetical protein
VGGGIGRPVRGLAHGILFETTNSTQSVTEFSIKRARSKTTCTLENGEVLQIFDEPAAKRALERVAVGT